MTPLKLPLFPPPQRFPSCERRARRLTPRQGQSSLPTRGNRRGTVLLLVMMLLVFLTLFATTLTYLSRLDARATQNASLATGTRMGAVTGLNYTISLLTPWLGMVPPNITFSAPTSTTLATAANAAASAAAPGQTPFTLNATETTAPGRIGDLAAKRVGYVPPVTLSKSPFTLRSTDAPALTPMPTSVPTPVPVLYPIIRLKDPATQLAISNITDTAGLINLNAIQSYQEPVTAAAGGTPTAPPSPPARIGLSPTILENLIANSGYYDATNSRLMAKQILLPRLGPDGQPGFAGVDDDGQRRALLQQQQSPSDPGSPPSPPTPPNPADIDDPNEYQPDISQDPSGDDTPYRRLENLKRIPGMTPALYQAIAPHLTTFSSNLELWRDAYNAIHGPIPLNSASTDEYIAVLKLLRPLAEETLLQQFAANLTDRRDPDSIPTLFEDVAGAYPVLGFEYTVVITEVCPDVITLTEDNDNGEYFELYNPLLSEIDLTGWRVDWGSGSHILTGSIAAQSFLVLTDDIMNANDDTPEDDTPGMGSFYDVFKDIATGSNRLEEILDMDLPDGQGMVRLLDPKGNLISYLAYRSATFNGLNRGFHKPNPFSNMAIPGPATPFEHQILIPKEGYDKTCWDILVAHMNKPFLNRAEILAVPTVHPLPGAIETEPQALFPKLRIGDGSLLDLRLLDCFTSVQADLPFASDGTLISIAPEAFTQYTTTTFQISHGKINLQTASQEVLGALPGVSPALAAQIVQTRARVMAGSGTTLTSDTLAFSSHSYFANSPSVWANQTDTDRLNAIYQLSPIITFNSLVYVITSSNRPETLPGQSRKKSLTCRATVTLTPGGAEILEWTYLPLKR